MNLYSMFVLAGLILVNPLTVADSKTKKTEEKCEITIEGTDQMSFQKDSKKLESISVPKNCANKTFTVHFNHVGKLPSTIMGHNFNVTLSKDAEAMDAEIMKIGIEKQFKITDLKKEPFKSKLLATSNQLIGGGEKDIKSVDIEIDMTKKEFKKGGDYLFFCSFPGHFAMMQGKFIVN